MFSQYKIRYLEEPQKVLGGAEEIHALARKGFTADFPKVAAFIKNFKIPLADLEGVMLKAKESTPAKEAAAYIAANGATVDTIDSGIAKRSAARRWKFDMTAPAGRFTTL